MKSDELKTTIDTTKDIKEGLVASIADAKQGKLKVGAVVRLIVLAIAWINQIATTFGTYSVPNVSPEVVYIIATVITVAVTLYSYWKNNSWSMNAKTADAVLDVLRETGITTDELADAVGGLLESKSVTKKEDTTK